MATKSGCDQKVTNASSDQSQLSSWHALIPGCLCKVLDEPRKRKPVPISPSCTERSTFDSLACIYTYLYMQLTCNSAALSLFCRSPISVSQLSSVCLSIAPQIVTHSTRSVCELNLYGKTDFKVVPGACAPDRQHTATMVLLLPKNHRVPMSDFPFSLKCSAKSVSGFWMFLWRLATARELKNWFCKRSRPGEVKCSSCPYMVIIYALAADGAFWERYFTVRMSSPIVLMNFCTLISSDSTLMRTVSLDSSVGSFFGDLWVLRVLSCQTWDLPDIYPTKLILVQLWFFSFESLNVRCCRPAKNRIGQPRKNRVRRSPRFRMSSWMTLWESVWAKVTGLGLPFLFGISLKHFVFPRHITMIENQGYWARRDLCGKNLGFRV